MKKVAHIILMLFLFSCGKNQKDYIEGSTESSGGIYYFKDTRTNICYSERGSGEGYVYTCVPCTEEVLRIIEKSSKKTTK